MLKCSCKGTPKLAEKPDGYCRFYIYCPICGKKTGLYPTKGGAEFNWDEYISSNRIKYEPILSETDKKAVHHADAYEMMKRYCEANSFDLDSASEVINYVTLSERYVNAAGINCFKKEDTWFEIIKNYISDSSINFNCTDTDTRLSREFRHAITSAGFQYSDEAELKLIEMYKNSHAKTRSLEASASCVYEMKAWIGRLVRIKQNSSLNQ